MTAKGTIQCPHCGATYRITAALAAKAGKDAHCAMCKGVFTIPESVGSNTQATPADSPAKPHSAKQQPHVAKPVKTAAHQQRSQPAAQVTPKSSPATDTPLKSTPPQKGAPQKKAPAQNRPAPARKTAPARHQEPAFETEPETPDTAEPGNEISSQYILELENLKSEQHAATAETAETGSAGYSTAIRGLKPDRKRQDNSQHHPSLAHPHREIPTAAPEVIIEPTVETRRHPGWIIAAVVMIVVLCLQLAWTFRDKPAVYNAISSISSLAGIQPPIIRSPQELELVNRLFTRVENSDSLFDLHLVVANRAIWTQPYPTIELTLTDKYGISRVRQRIRPEDYLQGNQQQYIKAGEEVEISFIVESSSSDVVGFLLDFM